MSDINQLVLEVLSDIPDNDNIHDNLKHIKNYVKNIDTDKAVSKVKETAGNLYHSAKGVAGNLYHTAKDKIHNATKPDSAPNFRQVLGEPSKPDSTQTMHRFKDVTNKAKSHIDKVSNITDKSNKFINHIKNVEDNHSLRMGHKGMEIGEKVGGKTGAEIGSKIGHTVGKGVDYAEKNQSKLSHAGAAAGGLAAGGLAAAYLSKRKK